MIKAAQPTVLFSSSELHSDFANEIKNSARLIAWPPPDFTKPKDHSVLEQAIENLFGYDWLIFANIRAVDFFLNRFRELDHDVSELDDFRVCAIGAEVRAKLEHHQIHVDVIPHSFANGIVVAALADYLGASENLRGVNFLMPRSVGSSDKLPEVLESIGARVDLVPAYQIVSHNQPGIEQLKALLLGGGIDYVVMMKPRDIEELGEVFDTNDLSALLIDVSIAVMDDNTDRAAAARNLSSHIRAGQGTQLMLAQAIIEHSQSRDDAKRF